jgi:hypothetical protein
MMAQRRGILTNDEVWQWFVLSLHNSFERKITSCIRESTDSLLFLYFGLVFHQDVPDNLKKSLSSIVFSSVPRRQMFRIPLDMPQGSVRETFYALISKFISRLNSLILLRRDEKTRHCVFEVGMGWALFRKCRRRENYRTVDACELPSWGTFLAM